MKTICSSAACVAALVATSAHAQSSVTLYGLIDAGISYTNNVGGSGRVALTSGNISGSRFGLRGAEDLGAGLKAVFMLENGFSVNNGQLAQNSRLFGRQAYVGLSSNTFGTVTMGRQYDNVVDFVSPLSGTAGTFGDSGFAHPYDNDNLQHSVRFNNSVKYTSANYGGFKFGGMYAFSNSTEFAVSRAYSAGASYTFGPVMAAAGYLQTNGSAAKTGTAFTNTGGAVDQAELKGNLTSDVQRTVAAGLNYTLGPAVLGFVYSHSQYEGTSAFGLNSGGVRFDNYEVNAMYKFTPSLKAGLSYVYTDGHLSGVTSFGTDPKWNQVNAIARYSLSKRTELYAEAMYQHATGNKNVAVMYNAGGSSSTANQVMGAAGILTHF
ncbi:Outer membrane protein porin [Paraburkholderia caribensis MBA4]|uniref:Outer membrane protein porin n=1 Tax=Paraburkholderia caribensis MBA4 TaxID=1323664 RepID=A0A0P0RIR7_9BURK|nr:porin [Paraburkholderia caribensis]ALL68507.1 Outer membrane protein porin [Paraburkholderia caribensis MBA4]